MYMCQMDKNKLMEKVNLLILWKDLGSEDVDQALVYVMIKCGDGSIPIDCLWSHVQVWY